MHTLALLLPFLSLVSLSFAQFNFFDQVTSKKLIPSFQSFFSNSQILPDVPRSSPTTASTAPKRRQRLELVSRGMGTRSVTSQYPILPFLILGLGLKISGRTARCDKYLCPGTISCVDKPSHCPCAFPKTEDKVELGEGLSVCASKGGWKEGEMVRKVELARKGLL